ncbi:hypothetical protein EDD22DRAFT_887448 [Suillus occidentalis]|nr:hypothetical protein EDD22DRAFT_887448 [Suillus occidentalis]
MDYFSPLIMFQFFCRWSYFKDDRILLIEMRSLIHEAPLEHLSTIFKLFFKFLDGLRHHCDNSVHIRTSMNSPLSSIVPDMLMRMESVTRNYRSSVVVFVECAFAQDVGSVLRKIKYEIASHPEVLMVILVVIDEDQRYRSPERTSEAWRMLRQETSSRSYSSFYSLSEDTHSSHDQPIVIAGHTWCHLTSARFHIWVRGDEPINIDVDNNELQACGTLFPNQDMDAVDAMIKKGMLMMRDCYATVCQEAAPGSNITALQDSVITFCSNWDDLLIGLKLGVWDAAYHRYLSWYYSAP